MLRAQDGRTVLLQHSDDIESVAGDFGYCQTEEPGVSAYDFLRETSNLGHRIDDPGYFQ